jgi:hypothetical protein
MRPTAPDSSRTAQRPHAGNVRWPAQRRRPACMAAHGRWLTTPAVQRSHGCMRRRDSGGKWRHPGQVKAATTEAHRREVARVDGGSSRWLWRRWGGRTGAQTRRSSSKASGILRGEMAMWGAVNCDRLKWSNWRRGATHRWREMAASRRCIDRLGSGI